MGTGRDELETLSRMDLVLRAKQAGVARADVLTRLELIDEILSVSVKDAKERTLARGLLGRARDLVARVVEKGLHLPDAAQRILSSSSSTNATVTQAPKPLPTVALARVYASQGHRTQARKVIEELLAADANNTAAIILRNQLDGIDPSKSKAEELLEIVSERPNPKEVPSEGEFDEPPPIQHLPIQNTLHVVRESVRLRVTWRLRPITFARARARMPTGRLVIRIVHTLATPRGPEVEMQDREVDRLSGTTILAAPPNTLSSHVAVGWRDGGLFSALITESSQ